MPFRGFQHLVALTIAAIIGVAPCAGSDLPPHVVGDFTRKVGLELDLTARGMGVRSQRYAMVVDNGVVKHLFVEAPGKFEVSSADHVLASL